MKVSVLTGYVMKELDSAYKPFVIIHAKLVAFFPTIAPLRDARESLPR
jgi:hypothetical protein